MRVDFPFSECTGEMFGDETSSAALEYSHVDNVDDVDNVDNELC